MVWEKVSHAKWESQDQTLLDQVLGADAPGCILYWALQAGGSSRHSWTFEGGGFAGIELTSQLLPVVRGATLLEP